MNKFKFYFIVLSSVMILFSCNKTDPPYVEPIRAFSTQFTIDNVIIEKYLNDHYIKTIIDHPGFSDDQDIVFDIKTPEIVKPTLWSLLNSTTYPKLLSIDVPLHDIVYKVYYLKLRPDLTTGKKPERVDNVLVSYDGSYLATGAEPKRFEYNPFPQQMFDLSAVIKGWQELIPLFRSGVVDVNEGANPAIYTNFGAGVMFIPSGLAYFYEAKSNIPAYSPLMFSFKLYDVADGDQDGDGIISKDEDLTSDQNYANDDTDGDGVQNYLDVDDDGDGYLTKFETKRPDTIVDGVTIINGYYPFNGAAVDDLSTLYDETKGVPSCGDSDFTTPSRKRKYLDSSCH